MKITSKKILKSLLSVSAIAAITGLTIAPVIITEPNSEKTTGDPSILALTTVTDLTTFDPVANTMTIKYTFAPETPGLDQWAFANYSEPINLSISSIPGTTGKLLPSLIGFTTPVVGSVLPLTEQQVVINLGYNAIPKYFIDNPIDQFVQLDWNLGHTSIASSVLNDFTALGSMIPEDVIPLNTQVPSSISTDDYGETYDFDFELFPIAAQARGWEIGASGFQVWGRNLTTGVEEQLTVTSSTYPLDVGSAVPPGIVTATLDGSAIDIFSSYDIYTVTDFRTVADSDGIFHPVDPAFGIKTSPSILLEDSGPTVEPSPMTFAFTEATESSLKYDFTYDNGSLNYNPIITATANGTAVLATDLNVNFDRPTNTGTIELLRLIPETSYEVVFTYNYLYKTEESVDPITASTLDALPFIAVSTSLDVSSQTFTVIVEGDATSIDDDSINTATGTANLVLVVDVVEYNIADSSNPDNLVGTHVFNVGPIIVAPTNISLDIVVNEVGTIAPLGLENIIIADGANNDEGITTSYALNGDPSVEDVIASRVTSITPSTGTNIGDLNLEWLVDYPLGITLSELRFVFEISTTDPTDTTTPTVWVDVSGNANINPGMKSGIISGLTDEAYSDGVWVQITIDYLDINEDLIPLPSTLSGIPKQADIPSSGLSTGALIGIIVGSVAGVALIGLGGWFFYKKQNPSKPKDGTGTKSKKEKSDSKKITSPFKKEKTDSKKTTTPSSKQKSESKKTTTPSNKENSVSKKITSPSNKENSVSKKITSPFKKASSESKKTTTPLKKEKTVSKKKTSPFKKQKTDSKKTTTPFKKEKTDSKKTTTPSNKEKNVSKKPKTSSNKKTTEAKKITSPSNKKTTDSKKITSPSNKEKNVSKKPKTSSKK